MPMNKFSKYEGAGNDFVMIDDRADVVRLSQDEIARICDRHFGVGADGLIILRYSADADYEMVYHNADGAVGSMCGNGARCAFAFARDLGIVDNKASFIAYDGLHYADARSEDVAITMQDVSGIEFDGTAYILDTGSPHYVKFVDDLAEVDIVTEGRSIRNGLRFKANGVNVNFVKAHDDYLRVSTYERGVEDLTLACGTGVTAVALAFAIKSGLQSGPVELKADGGSLTVNFIRRGEEFSDIVLAGPARRVFEGILPD